MATYQQRRGAWRAQVRLRGQSTSATFDTHEDARAWATAEEAKILAGAKVKRGRAAFVTVADLFRRYRDDVSPKKRGERWETIRLDMLARFPAFTVPLRDFGPEQMAGWRDARLKDVSAATVTREMNLISAVFRVAQREWGHQGLVNPVRQIDRPSKAPARRRRISDDEATAIRLALGWDGTSRPATASHWTAWCFAVALETAMRRGEIIGLTPDRVLLDEAKAVLLDGDEKDRIGQTKTGRGREVPLSSRARALFALTQPWTQGRPIAEVEPGTVDALFRRARDKAGISDLHFHDSRREAITRLARKVGDALELARISGHSDTRQLLDYFRPDATELARKLG